MDTERRTKQLLNEIEELIRIRIFPKINVASSWRTISQDNAFRVKKTLNLLDNDLKRLSSQVGRREGTGRKPAMSLDQKAKVLLVKQLLGESNRNMMYLLIVFSVVSGAFIGYKSMERLYFDKEVYSLLLELKDLLYIRY